MADRLDRLLTRENIIDRMNRLERANIHHAAATKTGKHLPPIPTSLSYTLEVETTDNVSWAYAELSWDATNVAHWVVGYQRAGENSKSHTVRTRDNSIRLRRLHCGRRYYIWVYAVHRRGYQSAIAYFDEGAYIRMPYPDRPSQPGGLNAYFDGGNLVCEWDRSIQNDHRSFCLQLWSGNDRGTNYLTTYPNANNFTWTFDDNREVTNALGLDPDPSIFVELNSVNYFGRGSDTTVTTATNAAPGEPDDAIYEFDGRDLTVEYSWGSDEDIEELEGELVYNDAI
tara:strand:+ start:3516 stop:4367 length:852 start_codon:yes stop_codon:yes gene_type:complete